MERNVILDTGPLVAFLNKDDRFHEWATEQWSEIRPPMLTCEAVIAETCYLIRHLENGSRNVLALLDRKVVAIGLELAEEYPHIIKFITRYANVPMSLADACLVRMAEKNAASRVLTLDQDFRIYRKNTRQMIPVLMPS